MGDLLECVRVGSVDAQPAANVRAALAISVRRDTGAWLFICMPGIIRSRRRGDLVCFLDQT